MNELDLSEINGGKVLVYAQCCAGNSQTSIYEIYLSVTDFEEENAGATVIMEPKHARQLAQMLLDVCDRMGRKND